MVQLRSAAETMRPVGDTLYYPAFARGPQSLTNDPLKVAGTAGILVSERPSRFRCPAFKTLHAMNPRQNKAIEVFF